MAKVIWLSGRVVVVGRIVDEVVVVVVVVVEVLSETVSGLD